MIDPNTALTVLAMCLAFAGSIFAAMAVMDRYRRLPLACAMAAWGASALILAIALTM